MRYARRSAIPAAATAVALALAAVVVCLLLVACGSNDDDQYSSAEASSESNAEEAPDSYDPARENSEPAAQPEPVPSEARQQPMNPLRAEIASLLMVGVRDFDDAVAKLDQGVGGIFITSWADPGLLSQPGRDIAALRERFGPDFDVAIDFEGGRVQRHADILGDFPAPADMAAQGVQAVEDYGRRIGRSLHEHGITVDFAPVVDVDGAGLEVVGDRAFSSDPHQAAQFAAAFSRGLRDQNVTPVLKHFPGHGRASGDSHDQDVVTPPLEQLRQFDLIPYAELLSPNEHGTPAAAAMSVMMGHMIVPGLSSQPASLSASAYDLLRDGGYPGAYPYDGVVYTDDLTGMRAITQHYRPADAVLQALRAGADRPLWSTSTPAELAEIIDTVENAVTQGDMPRESISDSARRVSEN